MDHSKFGRMAPAVGDTLGDMDHVILDRRPGSDFDPIVDSIGPRLLLAERDAA